MMSRIRVYTPNQLSINLANLVVTNNPEFTHMRDEIRYGLEWLISALIQILLVGILSILFNVFIEAFLTLFAGSILRIFIGGAHFSSYFKCTLIGSFLIVFISKISNLYSEYLFHDQIYLLSILLMVVIILRRAPVLHKTKDQFSLGKKRRYKSYGILWFITLVCLNTFVIEETSYRTCIWIGVMFQIFSITPIGGKLINKIDKWI